MMNPMELSCLAGNSIQEWYKDHVEGCLLSMDGETVLCSVIPKERKTYRAALSITAYEVKYGMKSARWNYIGATLHKIYCKENECQAHPKP